MSKKAPKTAFVFAGGGSLGAVQVGMLKALVRAGLKPDFVIGSSVGALNAGFFAGDPTQGGVARLESIWGAIRRTDVFPVTFGSALTWLQRAEGLFDSKGLRRLIERNLAYRNLEDAALPVHVVATDLGGVQVRLSQGPAVEAILASAAIPVVFPSVRIGAQRLIDGAISGNTPILAAAELGATQLIVLPTGFACALSEPPKGAVGQAMHALTLMIAHQMVRDLAQLSGSVEIRTVPHLCPSGVSPFDFSQTTRLIAQAASQTEQWIASGGLSRRDIPPMLFPHSH